MHGQQHSVRFYCMKLTTSCVDKVTIYILHMHMYKQLI